MHKIREIINKLQEKSKRAKQPLYTRQEFYQKLVLILFNMIAVAFLGQKLAWYDEQVYLRIFSVGYVQSLPEYWFYLGVQGLLLGLAFWRLLEVYWYGKYLVKESGLTL